MAKGANQKSKLLMLYLLLLAVILGVVWMLGSGSPIPSVSLDYSEFLEWVETDLRAAQGETLTEEEQKMSISRISIQEKTLYGLKETSLVSEDNFPAKYDFVVVVPSETQFYTDVNQIYENVWNENAFSAEKTVTVHIRRIREKIEINPKEPKYLKVVWGIGYKIEKF